MLVLLCDLKKKTILKEKFLKRRFNIKNVLKEVGQEKEGENQVVVKWGNKI